MSRIGCDKNKEASHTKAVLFAAEVQSVRRGDKTGVVQAKRKSFLVSQGSKKNVTDVLTWKISDFFPPK